MQINGTKITPVPIFIIAINLVGWGITLGTILTKLDALDARTTKLEAVDVRLWEAIHPVEASERKK